MDKGAYSDASADYPAVDAVCYYGRGPIQLSWNYNYGQASHFIYGDKTVLLNDPDAVSSDEEDNTPSTNNNISGKSTKSVKRNNKSKKNKTSTSSSFDKSSSTKAGSSSSSLQNIRPDFPGRTL